MPDFISLVTRILGSLVYALVVGWKLTLVFLSLSPLMIITFKMIVKVRKVCYYLIIHEIVL
jgi:hypothetical protein